MSEKWMITNLHDSLVIDWAFSTAVDRDEMHKLRPNGGQCTIEQAVAYLNNFGTPVTAQSGGVGFDEKQKDYLLKMLDTKREVLRPYTGSDGHEVVFIDSIIAKLRTAPEGVVLTREQAEQVSYWLSDTIPDNASEPKRLRAIIDAQLKAGNNG